MNPKWIIALVVAVLLLTSGGLAAANGNLTVTEPEPVEIKFSFAKKLALPMAGVPPEASHQGVEPGGRVADSTDHGSFSKLVAGHITAFNITWMDSKLFPTEIATAAFMRRLLATTTGSTFTFVIWSQSLSYPTITATVEHANGKPGQWLIWYNWPSIYFAYQDGTGKWWFGSWVHDDTLNLKEPKIGVQREAALLSGLAAEQ